MNTTNPYAPPAESDSDSEPKAQLDLQEGPRPISKRLLTALPVVLTLLASGPVIWLGFLVLFGIRDGEPLRVFHNRIVWEDEFVAKLPAALLISSAGAIIALSGILTERTPNQKRNVE